MSTLRALVGLAVLSSAAAAEPPATRPMSQAAFISAVSEEAVERFDLRRLGDDAAANLWDAPNPGTWAAAALVGGGVAWLDGVRLSRRLGPLDGAMRLRPNGGRLLLELAWRNSPFSASAQMRAAGQGVFGLQFRQAF